MVTLPAGMIVHDEHNVSNDLAWEKICDYWSVNRSLWRTARALFSRIVAASAEQTLQVDGIVRHYPLLQQEVMQHLPIGLERRGAKLDYSLLRSRWMAVALFVTGVVAYISYFNLLDPTFGRPSIPTAELHSRAYTYFIDTANTLHVVEQWQAEPPVEVGQLKLAGPCEEMTVNGRYLLLAAGEAGLRIVELAQVAKPRQVDVMDTPGYASGIAVLGDTAYVADGPSGLVIVDITQPASPTRLASLAMRSRITHLSASGNYLYTVGEPSGLRIFDVTYRTQPRFAGFLALPGQSVDLVLAGNYALVASGSAGLQVVDIADPFHPRIAGSYPTGATARDVTYAAGFAYVATGTSGLAVLYVQDPLHIVPANRFALPAAPITAVATNGSWTYFVDSSGIWRVFDASNPEDPIIIGSVGEQLHVQNVAVTPPYSLPITGAIFEFMRWGFVTLPIAALIRLLYNRRRCPPGSP